MELVTELFLQTLPLVTGLSVRECELLKEEWQENLVPQLEKWETYCQKRWKLFQEQLLQEKQVRPGLCSGTPGLKTGIQKKIPKCLSVGKHLLSKYTAQVQTWDGQFNVQYGVNIYAVCGLA